MKADLKAVKKEIDNTHDRGRFQEDLAELKTDLKAERKEIEYLKREAVLPARLHNKLRGLATKEEVRELITKEELRRITTDEVRKRVTEALVPTEKKLASLTSEDANLNQKIKGVEAVTHRHYETAEAKDQQQSSRFGVLDTCLSDMQTELTRLKLEIKVFNASVKTDTSIEEAIRLIRSDLDALKPKQEDLKLIRHDLDAWKADRENVGLIRGDLDSLINEEKLKDIGVSEGFEAIEDSLDKQREDISRLQNEIMLVKQPQASQTVPNHPPTPPFASASTSPREPDHQKLQDVEMGLRKLKKTTQGLELFVNSQQQKFDGLTSDFVVQSMIHQLQQMYPQHPGNLVALVNQIVARQASVDNYLSGNLTDRLANIDSQILARMGADSKFQEITRFTAESRTVLLATVNSLKQDVEGLKNLALNNRSQDLSNYGNRIDELADRVTTFEVKYVKAIGDLQTNHTDLVRNVTQLGYRNGIGSTRNAPGDLTVVSRNSKSIEPNGTAVLFDSDHDSDSSDAPLSQRSDHGVRQDREEGRSFDPNPKRKAAELDNEDEDEDGESRPPNARKVPKRRNVSGKSPFS